ncbi:MAG: hypothetical protein PHU04_02800 [Candidatus Peribacteraceae bacterium]|nr:hypothetical protein [Candidatus Peribacteraceae bacterium]
MNLNEMSEDIWRELHKLNSIMRINRTEFRIWKKTCCAYRDHQLYFSETEDAFVESMIMGIGRLLDRTKGVLSMEKWLLKGAKANPKEIDMKKLRESKVAYDKLVRSAVAKTILEIRHNYYAHAQPKWDVEETMKRITWKQLFETIESLQNIFNMAASAGMGNNSLFGEDTIHIMGFPASNIEKDVEAMLLAIEKECHSDENHQSQIERAQMRHEEKK